ncbi:hypothetical protein [Agrobacterium pusense]|uniref:hypothetical protein n=1 Tax=Agrobacterium pusense TaxID=648995 RepID=UPI0032DAB95D
MRDFPRDGEAVENLSAYFADAARRKRTLTLSFDRLFEIANPSSMATLAHILQNLIENQMLTQVYRVEYSTHTSSEDFHSLRDIPEILYDREGHEVTPDLYNTKSYYLFSGKNVDI